MKWLVAILILLVIFLAWRLLGSGGEVTGISYADCATLTLYFDDVDCKPKDNTGHWVDPMVVHRDDTVRWINNRTDAVTVSFPDHPELFGLERIELAGGGGTELTTVKVDSYEHDYLVSCADGGSGGPGAKVDPPPGP